MNTFWKPFVEWVTALRFKPFQKARLRLTAFYILMIAVILCGFSFILYYSLAKNLRDNFETEATIQQAHHKVIEDALERTQSTIVLVDVGVLLLVSFLAYVLAGKTLKPIERALEAQRQFSADASHEFRTPLSIVKHDIEVSLKSPHLGEHETRLMLQSNLEEINHMSTMVDQLLKLSRSEAELHAYEMEPVDLSEVLKTSVEKIQKLAKNKDITVAISTTETGRVLGNPAALQEVLINVLQNALDYTLPGGSVKCSVVASGKYMKLTIADTGIGIEAKDLPYVFKRFYKADNARTLRSNSSGLGLSIVYDIIHKHGGTVAIESVPGEGTSVMMYLPMLLS